MLIWINFYKVAGKDYIKHADGILINNVQLEQAGKYSCVAIQKLDDLKNIQEREMELIVECELKKSTEIWFSNLILPILDAPRQSDNLIEILGNIGDTALLRCHAKSNPSPRFSWLRNNYETFKNVDIRDDSSTLRVKIEQEESFNDNYTCIAENTHGRSSQNFVLKERILDDVNDARRTAEISTFFTVLIAAYMTL